MDISFCIVNTKGDLVKIALSYYDHQMVKAILDDQIELKLTFYDVTLIREIGREYVGYKLLYAVSDTLARFMKENDDAVLCFYCDTNSDFKRNHQSISPQEYRSRLFSRMFDRYTKSQNLMSLINHRVRIDIDENPMNSQFAHFICNKSHENVIRKIGEILMNAEK